MTLTSTCLEAQVIFRHSDTVLYKLYTSIYNLLLQKYFKSWSHHQGFPLKGTTAITSMATNRKTITAHIPASIKRKPGKILRWILSLCEIKNKQALK